MFVPQFGEKSMKKYLLLTAFSLACFSSSSSVAQVRKSVDGNGHIVAQILDVGNVTKSQDMDFGTIISQETAQTARLDYNGNLTGVLTAGISHPKAAEFAVTGLDGVQYTLSVTAENLKDQNGTGSNTMTLSNFKIAVDGNEYGNNTISITESADAIKVGADLAVKAKQTSGDYTGSITLTVTFL